MKLIIELSNSHGYKIISHDDTQIVIELKDTGSIRYKGPWLYTKEEGKIKDDKRIWIDERGKIEVSE